jgi:4'-phosphopantetheinyl transferase
MPRELDSPRPGVRLWLADLDAEDPGAADAWLSPSEKARAARFAFARDARRYRAGHVVLRRLLHAHDDLPPRAEFEIGPHGKPSSGGRPFNVSDSGSHLLVALGDTGGADIGVDLELLRPMDDSAELAERHFTAAERASLAAAPAEEASRCFLGGWTRKEACLKALGLGLGVDTSRFEAGLDAVERKVVVPTSVGEAAVFVRSLDVGTGLLAALAWGATSPADRHR